MNDAQGKTKLNLGSGKDYREGWLNVEINKQFKADIYADILEVDFAPNSFDAIILNDVITFINPRKIKGLLAKCFAWLKLNGNLVITTTNLRYIAKVISEESYTTNIYHEALCWLFGTDFFKYPDYGTNHAYWCFLPEEIILLCKEVGFGYVHNSTTCMNFGVIVVVYKPKESIEVCMTPKVN